MATYSSPHPSYSAGKQIPRERSEHELLSAAARGDAASLEVVYRRYWPELRRHALSIVGSVEAAEDVTQEAFTKTIHAISGGQRIVSVGSWLHRCVHNASLDVLRDNQRRGQIPLRGDDATPAQHDSSDQAHLRARSQAVLAAVATLTDHQRSAFLLAEVRGFDARQIALELGTSAGSVRVLLHKARGHIRELLGPDTAGLVGPILRQHFAIVEREHHKLSARGPLWLEQIKQQVAERTGQVSHWLSTAQQRIDGSIVAGGAAVAVTVALAAGPIGLGTGDNGADAAPPAAPPTSTAGGSGADPPAGLPNRDQGPTGITLGSSLLASLISKNSHSGESGSDSSGGNRHNKSHRQSSDSNQGGPAPGTVQNDARAPRIDVTSITTLSSCAVPADDPNAPPSCPDGDAQPGPSGPSVEPGTPQPTQPPSGGEPPILDPHPVQPADPVPVPSEPVQSPRGGEPILDPQPVQPVQP